MAYDASEILGSGQVAGARVLSKGFIVGHAAGPAGLGLAGGVTGALLSATASDVVARQRKKDNAGSVTPVIGRSAFLAATADDLALVAINQKSLTGKLSDVLARVPRSEVAAVDYDGGFVSHLTVAFTDGSKWEFDVAKGGGKACKVLAEEIKG
jgi:hypothetical protein